MAKRIKDNRKRSKLSLLSVDAEKRQTHFKLVKVFPNVKERLNYIKACIEMLDEPCDTVLVEGGYPEL